MASPTTGQVHIDKAMTNVSIAYRNANYIGDQVFPVVPVQKISDKYFTFDKGDWFRDEAGLRSPGTVGPIVEFSLGSAAYSCQPIAAGMWVADEVVDNADAPLQPRRDNDREGDVLSARSILHSWIPCPNMKNTVKIDDRA